jgi:primosomal protein N' (replication factor Y)
MNQVKFIDVYIPTLKNPIQKEKFTYKIQSLLSEKVQLGQLILVPFGKQEKVAIIASIHNKEPKFEAKEINEILDEEPIFSDQKLELIQEISDYYYLTPHIISNLFLTKKIVNKKLKPKLNKENGKIADSSFIEKLPKIKPTNHTLTSEQEHDYVIALK